jgi:hypothetical protein
MTELTSDQYVAVGETVMAAVLDFARGCEPVMTPLETARAFMGAAAMLAGRVIGREGAVAMLRHLADHLERGSSPSGAAN